MSFLRKHERYGIATAASLVAMLATMPSSSYAAEAQASQALDEVIVTGSRIVRDGYEAPTPLTVVDATALQSAATANMADQLRTMPVFAGNLTPAQGAGGPSSYQGGLNLLNLRNMGAARTLILLDGQRNVGARTDGVVDVNNIPQQLISRVDIVTGGASAVYGSDAVTGVVNFILDKEFTGVKGELSGGATTYGDAENWKVSLSAGFPFAGGRGHILLSGEVNDKKGIMDNPREWAKSGVGVITNPAYGTGPGQSTSVPERLVRYDTSTWYTKGGIIDRGPLKGIAFGDGGVPYMFNFGPLTSGIMTAGGDWRSTLVRAETISLDPTAKRKNAFFRASYDVTENFGVFAQLSWNSSFDDNDGFPHYQAGNGPVILSGNPFIPASVQAQMTALGLTSFQIGSMNYDLPVIGSSRNNQTNRNVVGANGNFGAFGSDWSWDAYFQNGHTRISYEATGVTRRSLRALAVDAVRHPTTGAIVCRSTLTNPTNGCVPYNPMGIGVNSEATMLYLTSGQNAHVNQTVTQNVWAGAVTGEPFSSWAGPVSIALSAEHRVEKAVSKPDAVTLLSDWQAGNFLPLDASYSVSEAAFETVVPLAQNTAFADSWDVTGAFRATDYSNSGYVSTWKVGTTYAPIPDIRIRATRSRDIRAPNLNDLYQRNIVGFNTAFDPFTNSVPTFLVDVAGNLNLRPEKADTTDIGVVLQPSFAPGLSFSVDWWDIKLKDALATPSFAAIIRFCFEGNQAYCSNITRTNGVITNLIQSPFNIAIQHTSGVDFEGSYRMPLSDISSLPGEVALHANLTKYIKNYINNNLTTPTDDVGQNSGGAPPNWSLTARLDYVLDSLTTSLTARAMSSGTMNNEHVVCTTGCPVSTIQNRTIDYNYMPGFLYFDASISYRFDVADTELETFFNVKNILNKDPALNPRTADEFNYVVPAANIQKYDALGRVFRAGVRFRM